MIRFEDVMEGLEILGDELAASGDRGNADFVSEVIGFIEEQRQLHIAKLIIDEGDCLRCPNCGNIVYRKNGRCVKCGQRTKA